jgi:hypothetical protein
VKRSEGQKVPLMSDHIIKPNTSTNIYPPETEIYYQRCRAAGVQSWTVPLKIITKIYSIRGGLKCCNYYFFRCCTWGCLHTSPPCFFRPDWLPAINLSVANSIRGAKGATHASVRRYGSRSKDPATENRSIHSFLIFPDSRRICSILASSGSELKLVSGHGLRLGDVFATESYG